MSRTSERSGSKSNWRRAWSGTGGRKHKPYGIKAVRNHKKHS